MYVLLLVSAASALEVMPRLQSALKAGGARFHEALKIVDHGTGERSVMTTEAIRSDETLLYMPWTLAGTGAKGKMTEMGIDASCIQGGVDEEQFLALWLLDTWSSQNEDDYLATLPTELQHLPTFWSIEDKEILEGSQLGAGLAYRELEDARFCQALRAKSIQFNALLEKDPGAWNWAMSLVRSRSFCFSSDPDDENKQFGMFPFADMLNHDCFPNSKWTISKDSALIIKARYNIEAETEVCISYGEHLEPCGALMNYGFIPAVFGAESSAVIRLDGNELCEKASRNFKMWIQDDGRYGEQWPPRERSIRLSVGSANAAKTALSLARVAVADDQVLDALVSRFQARKIDFERSERAKQFENDQSENQQADDEDDNTIICADLARDAMSLSNEVLALETLLEVLDIQLTDKFPTTLRQDLYNANHADTINSRNAAKAVAAEKLVLYHWRSTFQALKECIDDYVDCFDAGIHYSLVLDDLLTSSSRYVPTLVQALEASLESEDVVSLLEDEDDRTPSTTSTNSTASSASSSSSTTVQKTLSL